MSGTIVACMGKADWLMRMGMFILEILRMIRGLVMGCLFGVMVRGMMDLGRKISSMGLLLWSCWMVLKSKLNLIRVKKFVI